VPDMAIVMTDGKAQETDMVIQASRQVHDVSDKSNKFVFTLIYSFFVPKLCGFGRKFI